MFLGQAGTFLSFQARRSSATRSSTSDLTVVWCKSQYASHGYMDAATYSQEGKHVEKTCCAFFSSFHRSFFFFDDWKCVRSVLKNSDAKYNVKKVFQSHLPVVETGACVVAESSRRQKKSQKNKRRERTPPGLETIGPTNQLQTNKQVSIHETHTHTHTHTSTHT